MQKTVIPLFLALICSNLFAQEPKQEIKIVSDPWCPYTCEKEEGRPGILNDIAKEIFTPHNYTVNIESLNWARAVSDAREGKFNAIVGALKADAPDFKFPKNSPVSQVSCFFVRKGSPWKFKEISDLQKSILGVVRDYTYGDPLDRYVEKYKADKSKIEIVSGTKTAQRLFSMLLDHRIEIMVEDQRVAHYVLQRMGKENLIAEAGCLKPSELYLAFSPKLPNSDELVKIFDLEFAKLKASGKLKKILSSY